MTRNEFIRSVKVKIDEISPFDEPDNFIAGDGDSTYDKVKPIVTTIDENLDKAACDCLNDLPLTLLAKDVDYDTECVRVDRRGVGHVEGYDKYKRLVRVSCDPRYWDREVTAFMSSSDANYLKLQKNAILGVGLGAKPSVVYVPELQELELYSFCGKCIDHTEADVYFIECNKKAEDVKSSIEEFIILRCAIYVDTIFGEQRSSALTDQYNAKLQSILQ